MVDYGVIETKAKTDFPLRLLAINDKIRFLLEQYKPDYMSVEELFMGHNHTTVIGTAQARGAVLVEAGRAGVEVFEFTPGQVKLCPCDHTGKYRSCFCRQGCCRLSVRTVRISKAQRRIYLIY